MDEAWSCLASPHDVCAATHGVKIVAEVFLKLV